MKFTNSHRFYLAFIAAIAMLFLEAPRARAQLGVDTFNATRTYILAAPENLTAASGSVTNGPFDRARIIGTGKIDFLVTTNTGTTGGTLTATLYGSLDQTNLTALANYALISSPTPEIITNYYFGGTNLIATNSVLLPGAPITPTAYSAGFATPYLSPPAWTNSGPITLTGKSAEVGIRLTDAPRYLYVVWTPGGTATNFTASAILTAPNSQ